MATGGPAGVNVFKIAACQAARLAAFGRDKPDMAVPHVQKSHGFIGLVLNKPDYLRFLAALLVVFIALLL